MKKSILINDPLYGKATITSPILIELIESKAMQRLKKINQFGIPDEYYHLKNYSRYEHSIGVLLLLKKLDASEEEQIAGLLHDVSHTAFSHVIDWVIGNGKLENYQDNQHEKYILNSEIPAILQKYNYNPKHITEYKRFRLLERDIPAICADRIDYSLQEFPLSIAKQCFKSLKSYENEIIFSDKPTALLFATYFLKQQKEHWGGFEAVSRYVIFAKILRSAMKKQIITLEDFWEDDAYVIRKITSANDKKFEKLLVALRNRSLQTFPKSKKKFKKKFRYVDPKFLSNKQLRQVTIVDENFKRELEELKKENDKGISVALVM